MGNSPSAEMSFRIQWKDPKHPSAQTGELLQGEVIVFVNKVIDSIPVRLLLIGRETVGMKAGKQGRGNQEANNVVYSRGLVLRAFQGRQRVTTGVYSLPFSLKLPRTLPASDSLKASKGRGGFKIEYKLIVSMGSQYKREMVVDVLSAPLRSIQTPRWVMPTEYPMKSLGGGKASNGKIVMGAMIKNHAVGRGDNVELFLACRNNSAIDIGCVEVQIVEYMRWSMGKGKGTNDTYSVLKSVKSLSLPSNCKAQSRKKAGQQRRQVLQKQVCEELRRRCDPVLITIPNTARNTYQGKLVHVWHCVKISYMTKSMNNRNIIATVPIQVGRMPESIESPSVAPSHFDLVSVPMSSASSRQATRSMGSSSSSSGSSTRNGRRQQRSGLRSYSPRRGNSNRTGSADSLEGRTTSVTSQEESLGSGNVEVSLIRSPSPYSHTSLTSSLSGGSSTGSRRSRTNRDLNGLRIYTPTSISIQKQSIPEQAPVTLATPASKSSENVLIEAVSQ